jgi:hypothetical protein
MTTMNYLLQHTKKFWLNQAILSILSFYRLKQDGLINKIVEVITKIWITFLFVLAASGITKLIFELITNPSQFSNATFGVFDYL